MRKETENMAVERMEKVKAEGETKLFVVRPELKEGETEKEEIMIGARDMGPAKVLLPVIKELIYRGHPVSVLTDRPSETFLSNSLGDRMEETETGNFILESLPSRDPALIISGLSGSANSGIEYYLEATGQLLDKEKGQEKVPSILIEDYWGIATRKPQMDRKAWPDYICAFDEMSKKINEDNLRSAGVTTVKSENIFVTGSPAFDEIAFETDREETRKKVREKLKISEEDTLVSYIGGGPPGDLENLKILINNFNRAEIDGNKVKFTTRIHPAIFGSGPLAAYKEDYKKLVSSLENGQAIDTMGVFSTDEVCKAADIIVSAYSTEGIKAVYRGKISLFMLLPGLGKEELKRDAGLDNLPVVESGASIGVFDEQEMKQTIERAFDKDYQEEIRAVQKKHYNLDGQNTKRVVDLAERILAEKNKK